MSETPSHKEYFPEQTEFEVVSARVASLRAQAQERLDKAHALGRGIVFDGLRFGRRFLFIAATTAALPQHTDISPKISTAIGVGAGLILAIGSALQMYEKYEERSRNQELAQISNDETGPLLAKLDLLSGQQQSAKDLTSSI